MPTLDIKVPPELPQSMRKFMDEMKKYAALTDRVNQAARQSADAAKRRPEIPTSNVVGLFRRFDQTLRKFETTILRNIDSMARDLGPAGKFFIRNLPPVSSMNLDVSSLIRSARAGMGPWAIVGVVAYEAVRAIKWIYDQSLKLGEEIQKENRTALATGATIGGLRAFRIGFAMLPEDPAFLRNIALLRADAGSRRALALRFLGINSQINTIQLMVQAMLAAQRFMQAQTPGLELLMAEKFGLTTVFSPKLLLALRTMDRPEMEKWAAWILANQQNLTPPDNVRKSIIGFFQANQTLWDSVFNVFGEQLARSGLPDALIKVVDGMTVLTDKFAAIVLPDAAIKNIIVEIKGLTRALTYDVTKYQHEARKAVQDAIKLVEKWTDGLKRIIDDLIARTMGAPVAPSKLRLPALPALPPTGHRPAVVPSAAPPPLPPSLRAPAAPATPTAPAPPIAPSPSAPAPPAALPRRGRPAIGPQPSAPAPAVAPPSTSATPRGAPPPAVSTPTTPRGPAPSPAAPPPSTSTTPRGAPPPSVSTPATPRGTYTPPTSAGGRALPLYPFGYPPRGAPQALPPGWQGIPPPPNGRIDRSQFENELADPQVRQRLAWMVNGEVGRNASEEQRQIQLETVFNRAQSRGLTLRQALGVHGVDQRGYYATSTFRAGEVPNATEQAEFDQGILAAVRAGSDRGTERFGFTPTGNASGLGFAGRRAAAGDTYYARSAWYSGRVGVGEMYALERYDRDLVGNLPRTGPGKWIRTPWMAPPPQVRPESFRAFDKDSTGKAIDDATYRQAEHLAATGDVEGVKQFIRNQGYHVDSQYCGDFVGAVVKARGGTPPKHFPVATAWANAGEPVNPGDEKPGDIAIYKGHAPYWGATGGHVGIVGSKGAMGDGKFQFFAANNTVERTASEHGVVFRRIPGMSGSMSDEEKEKAKPRPIPYLTNTPGVDIKKEHPLATLKIDNRSDRNIQALNDAAVAGGGP